MRILRIFLLTFAVSLVLAFPAYASDLSDIVQFHGFGGWAYTKTDGNIYLDGNEDGNYDNFQFSLSVAANPAENLRVVAQAFWEESIDEDLVGLDYGFAEWFFDELLILRIGKVKQPIGIYNEVHDVGTVRPFYYLPKGIDGFVNEAYKGLGFTGSYYTDEGWGLDYDIYGGSLDVTVNYNAHLLPIIEQIQSIATAFGGGTTGTVTQPQATTLPAGTDPMELLASFPTTFEMDAIQEEVIGGRIIVRSPYDLSIGFSSSTGKLKQFVGESSELALIASEEDLKGFTESLRSTNYAAQLEYIYKTLTLRSEYYYGEVDDGKDDKDIIAQMAYVELAIKLIKQLEIAGRYEKADYEYNIEDINPDVFPSLLEHEEWALGLNYWFNSNFVIKCSYHFVTGNYFALPETMTEIVDKVMAGEEIEDETHLIVVGTQFNF